MIHLVRQYKKLFNFMLTANEDMVWAVDAYESMHEKNKEAAQYDSEKLNNPSTIPWFDNKAKSLAKWLEKNLPHTVDIRHIDIEDLDFVLKKLKPWDTVITNDSDDFYMQTDLEKRWINLKVIRETDKVSDESNQNLDNSINWNNWHIIINWENYDNY